MNIIPTMRCRTIAKSIHFYTDVLDFESIGTWPESGDPAFAALIREGCELHLSSHAGDGTPGQAVAVLTQDADALFHKFLSRGLDVSAKPNSPVHQSVVAQTWGTREFYVDDPDGNTLRFIQR